MDSNIEVQPAKHDYELIRRLSKLYKEYEDHRVKITDMPYLDWIPRYDGSSVPITRFEKQYVKPSFSGFMAWIQDLDETS